MSTVFLYFALFMVPFTPPYSNSLTDLIFISSSTPSPDNLQTTFDPQLTLPVPMNCTQQNAYDRMKVEGDPMIYILTMLIVFSAGIASLMIIYMKKVVVFHNLISKPLETGAARPRGCKSLQNLR